jgi:hypothetical protein
MTQQLTKKRVRQQWSELRDLLNGWDFIGVMDDPNWPRDEYECLIGPLLGRLQSGQAVPELAQFLEDELRDHFGMHRVETLDDFAKRAKSWFDEKWSAPVK